MKIFKKLSAIKMLFIMGAINFTIHASSPVTCTFTNTAEFPVTFKSFTDNYNNPAETQNLNPGQSFTSNIHANQSVTYDVQSNIYSKIFPVYRGSYDIIYNLNTNTFSLGDSDFTNPDVLSQNAVITILQVTNRTAFPINVAIALRDMGQGTEYQSTMQEQTLNQTRLMPNQFYAITDEIQHFIVASDLDRYNSGPLLLTSVGHTCNIINNNGSLNFSMNS